MSRVKFTRLIFNIKSVFVKKAIAHLEKKGLLVLFFLRVNNQADAKKVAL
jgi:hypothetical protein